MPMAPVVSKKKEPCRGAWTAEEDHKLVQVIEIYGPKRWKFIAAKAGVNRCGKSCRLRWLNYLRPNIKRGNISDQEEDLILRLHKLLGNRWSLIARRLPGRTDNEIKNYWNSHLSKKMNMQKKNKDLKAESMAEISSTSAIDVVKNKDVGPSKIKENMGFSFIQDEDLFSCGDDGALNFEWMSKFLEMDQNNWFDFDLHNHIM